MHLLTLLSIFVVLLTSNAKRVDAYDKQWVVEVKHASHVHEVARESGCTVIEQLELPGFIFVLSCKPSTLSLQSGLRGQSLVVRSEEQLELNLVLKSDMPYNDKYYGEQWYLRSDNPFNIDVQKAWKEGLTGRGVRISIVDNGVEANHPDLVHAFDRNASIYLLPNPHEAIKDHGTPVAGIIAAQPDNSKCTVGIAFGATISSATIFNWRPPTDSSVCKALSHRRSDTDIYSNSWGPSDNAATVDGPATFTKESIKAGVTMGRQGLGSIYFFAAGNGKQKGDSCEFDGYVNNPYIMGISGVAKHGITPDFAEECSAVMAATLTKKTMNPRTKGIATTDLYGGCTERFGGTSAATPMASAAAALTLQANPNLTWRDLQHIITLTARPELCPYGRWITNKRRYRVSYQCGFGVMSAHRMTSLAKLWTRVPTQLSYEASTKFPFKLNMKGNRHNQSVLTKVPGRYINYLESVLLSIEGSLSNRGALEVLLESPMGTRCVMIPTRSKDKHRGESNLHLWPQKSYFFWGERMAGSWHMKFRSEDRNFIGLIRSIKLTFYGTNRQPIKIRKPRQVPFWLKRHRRRFIYHNSLLLNPDDSTDKIPFRMEEKLDAKIIVRKNNEV